MGQIFQNIGPKTTWHIPSENERISNEKGTILEGLVLGGVDHLTIALPSDTLEVNT